MQDTLSGTVWSSRAWLLLLLLTLICSLSGCWASFQRDDAAARLHCPEGCHCVETTGLVNCSNGHWTYIPAVPSFARQVLFENNSLHQIDNTTFDNLIMHGAKIYVLGLSGNPIKTFTRKSFTELKYLRTLHLERVSHNYSMFQEMFKDLNTLVNLTLLSISRNKLKGNESLPRAFFEPLGKSNLSVLFLEEIDTSNYNHADFVYLKNLRRLHLRGNNIREVKLAISDTLELLDLSNNRIVDLPDFCHPHTYFRNLQLLLLNENLIYEVSGHCISCLSELRNISLAMNVVHRIRANTFAALPRLNSVFLYSMRIAWLSLSNFAFNNSNIKSLLLYSNRMEFLVSVGSKAFYGCDNLEYLEISVNSMYRFTQQNFSDMFGHLSKLQFLGVASCRLHFLPFSSLDYFPNLRRINLRSNKLQDLDGNAFKDLKHLQILDASYNQIQSVEESLKPVLDRLTLIDLAFNTFECDCKLLWFKEYLKANYSRFYDHAYGYKCSTPLNVRHHHITSLPLSDRTCLVPHDVGLVIIICCCVVILLTVAVALRWRYRWDLHFLLLVLERRHSRRRPVAFSHDYYVSADMDSDTDRMWVLQQLMPRLTHFGLRACSAEDTTPGHPELSSALTAMMEQCQRVLFVVSNDYAQSGRCQFELTLALKASLELQRQDITVILLEPIASRYVSSALQVLVKEFTCLPWPTDSADLETARDRFWETLHSALVPCNDTT